MSNIYKVGKNYYVRFWADGREYRRATGHTDLKRAKVEAERIADEVRRKATPDDLFARALVADGLIPVPGESIRAQVFRHLVAGLPPNEVAEVLLQRYRQAESAAANPRTQRSIRAERLQWGRTLSGEQSQRIALADIMDAWRKAPKKREPSAVTIATMYEPMLRRFSTWAEGRGRKFMHEITEADAFAFMSWFKGQGFSVRSQRASRTLLKGIWHSLEVQAGLADVWSKTPLPDQEHGVRDALSAEQVTALFNACQNPEERALLGLGLFAGLRLGDAAALPLESVNFTKGLIELRPRKTAKRHGTVARIPILPPLRILLDDVRRPKGSPYVLPRLGRTYNRNPHEIQDLARAIFERAGIVTAMEPEKNRIRARSLGAFHRLRHSFVTAAARAGLPPSIIRQMTGHNSMIVQQLYEHMSDTDLIEAGSKLPALIEMKISTDSHKKPGNRR